MTKTNDNDSATPSEADSSHNDPLSDTETSAAAVATATTSSTQPSPPCANRDQVLLTLLAGVYDPGSVLSQLRGIPHLVKRVFELSTNELWWRKCIRLPDAELDRKLFQLMQEKGYLFDHRRRHFDDRDRLLFLAEVDARSLDQQSFSTGYDEPRCLRFGICGMVFNG